MNKPHIRNNLSRALGVAFFLQAFTSLTSGAFLFNPLVDKANISKTMLNIGNNPGFVYASIIGDILTALGIILLATILYTALKNQSKIMALVALGFYIFEAGILAISKFAIFVLLMISQEYIATGDQALEMMANLALETKDFIYRVHIIPFGFGAILFYYLLYKSNIVPQWLSLWGLITVPFVLVGAGVLALGIQMPAVFLALAVPYLPFEFFAGIYILVRGFNTEAQENVQIGRNG